jgi:hypothetical protein
MICRYNSCKNPVGKLGENMTTYYWYCLLDNSHENLFREKPWMSCEANMCRWYFLQKPPW